MPDSNECKETQANIWRLYSCSPQIDSLAEGLVWLDNASVIES